MTDRPEIAIIRAVWATHSYTIDEAKTATVDVAAYNASVGLAQRDIATLLADVDAAKSREFALLSRIALLRNHLVDQVKWGYMATTTGPVITEYQAAQMAVEWLRRQGLEEAPQ